MTTLSPIWPSLIVCLLGIIVVFSIVSGMTFENYRRRQIEFRSRWAPLKILAVSIFGGLTGTAIGNLLGTYGMSIFANHSEDPAAIIGPVSLLLCFLGSSVAAALTLENSAEISPMKP